MRAVNRSEEKEKNGRFVCCFQIRYRRKKQRDKLWGYYGRRIIFCVGTGARDFRVVVYNVHGFD